MDHISQDNVISLAGVDWQQAWEYEDSRRVRPANASHWSGRAKSYGARTIGTPDAGAVSMACFFHGLAKD